MLHFQPVFAVIIHVIRHIIQKDGAPRLRKHSKIFGSNCHCFFSAKIGIIQLTHVVQKNHITVEI